MLKTCGDENCNRWSEVLWFRQLMKNRAFHSRIKRASYTAMFGHFKVGLLTFHKLLLLILELKRGLKKFAICTEYNRNQVKNMKEI